MTRSRGRSLTRSIAVSGAGCLLAALLVGCGDQGEKAAAGRGAAADPNSSAEANPAIPICPCAADPTAGDPSVPPELGGPGFTGEGWETVTEIPALGKLDAPKGGMVTQVVGEWPATLRQAGSGSNEAFNDFLASMCYESLLDIHPSTLELVPALATHWQISDDQMTYRFRLNPRARWSDGHEVTADDVVATFRLLTAPGMQDASLLTYEKLGQPRALSKYLVEVNAKVLNWRNFLYFAAKSIFPAHEIGAIDGKTYLDRYQFKLTAVTGPYEVRPENIVQGMSITLTRRPDYWGKDECFARGRWNFDQIKFVVVKDENLAFEKLKKGEIDLFGISKAQWWAEEVDKIDGVQRGLIQKRRIFADSPIGVRGIAINTRRLPLDDLRVRLALCHLLNRELMIEKLYYNQYSVLCSDFQGGIYQNAGNRPVPYDPDRAMILLGEAGWTERGPDGTLVKNGRRLEFDLQYDSKLSERFLTLYQEECLRAGVKLNLELINGSTRWKNLMDRQFQLSLTGWSALLFPNPESSYHSRLAAEKDNNNVTGFSDPRVDALCAQYDRAFDIQERIRIIREIDGIVFSQHHYVLSWYSPAERLLYWNRFGHPDWYFPRTGGSDWVLRSWWIDPEKSKLVAAGQIDPQITMPKGEVDVRFWESYGGQEGPMAASPAGSAR